jgi:hypothetical protein
MGRRHQVLRLAGLLACLISAMAAAEDETRLLGDEDLGGGASKTTCPPGQFMIGIAARTGDWVDRMGPICGRWSAQEERFISADPAAFYGGDGGKPQNVTCAGDKHPVTSLRVAMGISPHHVGNFALGCEGKPYIWTQNNASELPCDNTLPILYCLQKPPDEVGCPAGEAAIGLTMRTANFVNDVGLICAPFDKTVDSPIADQSIFYLPSLPDGTRVDACLQTSTQCGQAAADRYCELRGRSGAIADAFELDPHIGGFSHANGTTSTQPIGELKPCAAEFCTGFKSITCKCEARDPDTKLFDVPAVEKTGTRLSFCNQGTGKSTCSPSLPAHWRSKCQQSYEEKNECGQKPADTFCVQKGFLRAESFEEESNAGATGPTQIIGVLNAPLCHGQGCMGFKSINCSGVLNPTTCKGLNAKSYSPCTNGMSLNDKGACECPKPKMWLGTQCMHSPAAANVNVKVPDPTRPVRIPATFGCKPPRPVGTPPHCCPEYYYYINGVCRPRGVLKANPGVKPITRTPVPRPGPVVIPQVTHTQQYVNNPTTGTGARKCSRARPVGVPPHCCPSGTYYLAGRCRWGRQTVPATGGGTTSTVRCANGALVKSYNACGPTSVTRTFNFNRTPGGGGAGGMPKPATPQSSPSKSYSQNSRYRRMHRIHEALQRNRQAAPACCDKRNLPGCKICGLH